MTKELKPFSWDDAFEEVAQENRKISLEVEAYWESPEGKARKQAQIEEEIRKGLRDADGEWIEQPESEEEDEDEGDWYGDEEA